MTVAAIILADGTDPLAEAVGRPAVRRIVDSAWAGGALPIIVVAAGDGVEEAVAGSPARVVQPRGDRTGAWTAGVAEALAAVGDTGALLLWPLSMTWVDPETVTSLIEASGSRRGRALRPVYGGQPGWPLLIPTELAETIGLAGGDAGIELADGAPPLDDVDLGDPGTTTGIAVPLDDLPAFEGPSEPVGGPPPEWGAAAADVPD